eukprot:4438444-Pyramimonas_sp.AAC.1
MKEDGRSKMRLWVRGLQRRRGSDNMTWPPRGGEVPLRSAQCLTPRGPPAAFDSGEPSSSPRKR